MSQLVVTTGARFTDIDALACVIAYKEIPPIPPIAVISGPLNNSVTPEIRRWPMDYLTNLKDNDFDFVIVDLSEKDNFPSFVKVRRVIEIYDHHFGFEKYWQRRLGNKAKIEPVGACATLIFEEFKRRSQNSPPPQPIPDSQPTTHPHPSSIAANLLYTAIVSNTLNFQASITTERDKKAFAELKPFTSLPKNWLAQYYRDQEVNIYRDPMITIANDTKIAEIKGISCAIGQVELWNSKNFIKEHQNQIESALKGFETSTWFFTSPSISEGRNYIFTKSETIKNWLRSVMAIDFFGTDIGVTDRLWLRKEILKKIQ